MMWTIRNNELHNLATGEMWMSASAAEMAAIDEVVSVVRGDLLKTGLGMALFAKAALANPDVETLTVIEKEQGVIDLHTDWINANAGRLRVICADAWDWVPDQMFDWAYHDIYRGSKAAALERLMDRYSTVCDFQAAWTPERVIYRRA